MHPTVAAALRQIVKVLAPWAKGFRRRHDEDVGSDSRERVPTPGIIRRSVYIFASCVDLRDGMGIDGDAGRAFCGQLRPRVRTARTPIHIPRRLRTRADRLLTSPPVAGFGIGTQVHGMSGHAFAGHVRAGFEGRIPFLSILTLHRGCRFAQIILTGSSTGCRGKLVGRFAIRLNLSGSESCVVALATVVRLDNLGGWGGMGFDDLASFRIVVGQIMGRQIDGLIGSIVVAKRIILVQISQASSSWSVRGKPSMSA